MSAVTFVSKEKISESLGINSERFEELRGSIAGVLAKAMMTHTTDIMEGKISMQAEIDVKVVLEGISALANNANEALYIGYISGMGVEHIKSQLSSILEEED